MSQKYEIVPMDGRTFPISELAEAIYFSEKSDEISRHGGKGEWYCRNEDCITREVTIHFKLIFDGDKLPDVLKCPVCGGILSFHHWLKSEMLLPCKDMTDDEFARLLHEKRVELGIVE